MHRIKRLIDHPLATHFFGWLCIVLFIVAFVAVMNIRAAWSWDVPEEPQIELLDHWEPIASGMVALWYPMGGLMVGFAHAASNEQTKKQPGRVWIDNNRIFLVTDDPSHPALYIADRQPLAYQHPYMGPGWHMLMMKTWDTECGCPMN